MVLVGGPFGLGAPELLIVLAIVILLFGATRIGDVMGGLGKGVREFKKNVKDDDEAPESAPATSTASAPTNGAGSDAIAAVKCASCGALNEVSAKHCNQCGAAIAAPVS